MKKEKLYFKDEDSETCCELSEQMFQAKCDDLKEIELIEAIPVTDPKGYIWCSEKCTAVNQSECRKSYCDYYDPLNGKNGVCNFRGKLYKKGQKVKFDVV